MYRSIDQLVFQMLSLEQAIRTALDEEAVNPLALARNTTPRSSLRSSRRKIVAGKDRIMTKVHEQQPDVATEAGPASAASKAATPKEKQRLAALGALCDTRVADVKFGSANTEQFALGPTGLISTRTGVPALN